MSTTIRLAFLGLCFAAIATTEPSKPYTRPSASKELDLELSILSPSAEPHSPEQVHLALAGPASVAVSWVTHPQVECNALQKDFGQSVNTVKSCSGYSHKTCLLLPN